MTTSAELNASFDKLAKTMLKVKRDRDELLDACITAARALKRAKYGEGFLELTEVTALLDATIDRAKASV